VRLTAYLWFCHVACYLKEPSYYHDAPMLHQECRTDIGTDSKGKHNKSLRSQCKMNLAPPLTNIHICMHVCTHTKVNSVTYSTSMGTSWCKMYDLKIRKIYIISFFQYKAVYIISINCIFPADSKHNNQEHNKDIKQSIIICMNIYRINLWLQLLYRMQTI
jgi:hypothetical protein